MLESRSNQPSSRLSRRRWLQNAALVTAGGLLAACAPTPPQAPAKPAEAPKPAAPAATTAPAAAAPAVAAKPAAPSGGNWAMPISGEPVFNPVVAAGAESNHVNAVMFNQLLRLDKETLRPSPDLAEKWEASPDGKTWTFTLRKDVKWHDGKPFTADDVKFTFDSILNPSTNTRLRGDLSTISEVTVVDPSTVKFQLKSSFAPLPVFLAYTCGIVPKHLLEGKDINTAADFNKKSPVGTGPFKLKEYVTGSHAQLVANPDYFRGKPKLDSITFKIVPDQNAILAQLNTGELAFASGTAPSVFTGLDPNKVDVVRVDRPGWIHLSPNMKNPLFQDKKVRQAISHAINRQAISNSAGDGQLQPAGGPIPPLLKDWFNPATQPVAQDLEKAKALMAEAGWKPGADGILQKDGKPFKFTLTWGRTAGRDAFGVPAHQDLKKLGMDVTAEVGEWTAYLKRFQERDFEMVLDGWVAPYDPDLYSYFHSSAATGGKNVSQFSSPVLDKLLEDGRAEIDPAKRKKIYDDMQAFVYDELPEIFVVYRPEFQARAKGFGGIPMMALQLGDPLCFADEFFKG